MPLKMPLYFSPRLRLLNIIPLKLLSISYIPNSYSVDQSHELMLPRSSPSIQYKFPEALLALEGQKSRDEIVQDEEEAGDIYSSKKQSHRSGESSDDDQGNPFAVEVVWPTFCFKRYLDNRF